MRIAQDYGRILNPDCRHLDQLINTYPSHTFVIDREQARRMFKNVREPSDKEVALCEALGQIVLDQSETGIIEILTPPEPAKPVVAPGVDKKDAGNSVETTQTSESNESSQSEQNGNGEAGKPSVAPAGATALSSRP